MLSAEFLENNYERVFTSYQRLLNSENYVTRRQALKVGVRRRVDFQLFIVKYHLYLSISFTRRNDLQKVMVLRDKCVYRFTVKSKWFIKLNFIWCTTVTWLESCSYGIKHKTINKFNDVFLSAWYKIYVHCQYWCLLYIYLLISYTFCHIFSY